MCASICFRLNLHVSVSAVRIALNSFKSIVILVSFFLGAIPMFSGMPYFAGGVPMLGSGGEVGWATCWSGLRGMVFMGVKTPISVSSPGLSLTTMIVSLAFLSAVGFD